MLIYSKKKIEIFRTFVKKQNKNSYLKKIIIELRKTIILLFTDKNVRVRHNVFFCVCIELRIFKKQLPVCKSWDEYRTAIYC